MLYGDCPKYSANWFVVRFLWVPFSTLASSWPWFCSFRMSDTVSGVLAGVLPKTRAPGRAEASTLPPTGVREFAAGVAAEVAELQVRTEATAIAPSVNPRIGRERMNLI